MFRSADAYHEVLEDCMTAKRTIPDGVYFLHPDGSTWIAARYRSGHFVGQTEECLSQTHASARDRWSLVGPKVSDQIVDEEISELVIADVMPGSVPDCIVVTRAEE